MRKNFVLTPLMVMLASGAAFAQDTATATLTGRVTSSKDDRPLAGVRIRIESPSMLGVRNATTDASGNFRVPLLPNGEYSVLYTLDGYFTRRVTLRLIAGQTINGSARLNDMTVQEATVEITAQQAMVDKTDTIVQTTFSSDYLEKIAGRSVNALGALAPGINTSSLTTQDRLNIRGGTGHSTKTLLNGATMTELYGGYMFGTFDVQDLIESVALIQSPLNARYGNSDGGIVTIVTSKGSNTFTGTIRVTGIGRSYWSIIDRGYPNRDGTVGTPVISTTDQLSKNYEVSVQGPIWKDRITFAYGGKLTPATYSTPLVSSTNPDGAIWNTVQAGETPYFPSSNRGRPSDRVGTFYEDPLTGVIIRKPEMWLYNTPEGAFNKVQQSVYNQFTVFYQITPSHQLEYNYSQNVYTDSDDSQQYQAQSGEPWNKYRTFNGNWNAVYKGVIGSFGVLDINYGKTNRLWQYGDAKYPDNFPIRSWTMASRVPKDGNRNNHNFSNYWSNGFVWASINQGIANNNGTGANYNAQAGFRNQLHNGVNIDTWDGGKTENLTINYQHIWNAGNKGTHMFDVGMSSQSLEWFKKAGGPLRLFDVSGTIAKDLALSDIYNPRGASGINPADYAGKYIVFNVRTATLNDVDPNGVERFGIDGGRRFADYVVRNRGPFPTDTWASNFAPRVLLREGDFDGTYDTNMVSYYLNDLWTINDHHSVQGGVRIDNFEVVASKKSFFNYSQPTFRFEYKWDIKGDQSRLVNVSWAQFHSMQPAGLFTSMINARGTTTRTAYWVAGSARPYLVTLADIMNPANYGLQSDWSTKADNNLEGLPNASGSSRFGIDPNWKAPISSELQLGFRRNLSLGGSWKTTFVYRTWINDFDYYPGELFTETSITGGTTVNTRTIKRILRNTEGYERKYTGVELEWDLPVTKRITFGGSYTFNRLMNTTPDRTDNPGATNTPAMNWDAYWDYMTGGRDVWNPSRLMNPEHYFKWYLLFDFTSGKIQSSLAFRGAYTSGTPNTRGYFFRYGFPTDWNTDYRQLITGTGGGTVTGSSGTDGFSDTRYVPTETVNMTYQDSWSLNMRYSVNAPISKKLRWLANVDVLNPFNHRGIGGWYSASGADTTIVPVALTTGTPAAQYNIYGVNNDPTKSVWRPNIGATGQNSQYTARMGGRSISVETGIRF